MQLTRIDDAVPYEAPKHYAMTALRLQGFDATSSEAFWVGLSYFLPGGGAEMDAGPLEKVYVVLDGTVTVATEDGEVTLNPLDSCLVAAGEARAVVNRGSRPASMLVIMPHPEGVR
jgi:mannose-6-phosphate isomerase-like protein (cupin superfamily)